MPLNAVETKHPRYCDTLTSRIRARSISISLLVLRHLSTKMMRMHSSSFTISLELEDNSIKVASKDCLKPSLII